MPWKSPTVLRNLYKQGKMSREDYQNELLKFEVTYNPDTNKTTYKYKPNRHITDRVKKLINRK